MDKEIADLVIGKDVIIRSENSGVHFGKLLRWPTKSVVLIENSRRLWEWDTGGTGISLSELALYGIDQSKSRISSALPQHIVLDAIEIMLCYGVAAETIRGAEVAKPR